ncbi:VanW family protein [Clostridium thermarum]|uniref:VanW family protein n=1 Tax=Clostridium thermarum TaxID=1716543 RepID=UPI00111E7BB3|nr:VanW family protein [Clostridium thermarum]
MKNKKQLFIFPIMLFIIIVTAFGYIYYYVSKWDDKVYPNTFIGDTNISGLTIAEAKSALINYNKKLCSRNIHVIYDQKEYNLTYDDLQVEMELDNTINTAFKYGKDNNMLGKLSTLRAQKENRYEVVLKYNADNIKQFVEKVKQDINRPPVNASISKINRGKPSIVKEVIGKKVDENKLYNDIVNSISYDSPDSLTINITVGNEKPTITEAEISAIDSLVSTFTTHYSTASVGRAENIAIAAAKLNGKLLMSGEEFSFNKETGARTLENGFKGAPVIIKGKLVDGVAGGVCQVSTTLYNSIIKLGIKPLERRNHSLAPAYIGLGYDATVAEYIDFKFKNTLKYPLYIESKAGNGSITFNIYSNSSVTEIKYKLQNEIVEVIEPEIIYKQVDTLPKGTIEKVQDPIAGYKVKVYLVAYKNGKEIKRELLSRDNYKKVDGIYNVGA